MSLRATYTLVVALVLGLAAGCSGGASERSGTPTSPIPEATSAPLPEFVTAGTYSGENVVRVASRKYVAVVTGESASQGRGTTMELRRRSDGAVVFTHRSPRGFHVNDVFLDRRFLVVVDSHDLEEQPDRPAVIDLADGSWQETRLSDDAPEPVTGSWAMQGGTLFYNTAGPAGGYCLAEADLTTLTGAEIDCVERRHGMNQLNPSPFGVGFTTFDDHRPMSCLTPRVRLAGADPATVGGLPDCRAWEVLPAGRDAVIWSVVTKPNRIETAEFSAQTGDGAAEKLGSGTTGTLTWCGDAAWFVNQPRGQLLRWTPDQGLEVAIDWPSPEKDPSAGGISAPMCGGDAVAVLEGRVTDDNEFEDVLHVAEVPRSS